MNELDNVLYTNKIYAKQVRSVYGSFIVAVIGMFIASFLLMIIQWDVVDKNNMSIWFWCFQYFNL